MFRCANIPPHLLRWLSNYLLNRTQQTVVSGSNSTKTHAVSGVPQGSILGPLLFILYINDLSTLPISPSSKIILYADDILLSCPIKSPSSFQSAQSDINLISSCISALHLTINPNKTKLMIITRKPARFSSSLPPLLISGHAIERVYSYKYLGILITSNLSWTPHIRSICTKTRKLIGILFRHFYHHSPPNALLKLYKSLILPHFLYCSSVWDPPKSSVNSNSLERVQHFGLRMCTRSWKADYPSILSSTNLPSLSSSRSRSKLLLLYKILHGYLFFPPNILVYSPHPLRSSRHYHPCNLVVPYSRTSSSLHSFIPSACSLWNSLPPIIKSSSTISSFKCKIANVYYN